MAKHERKSFKIAAPEYQDFLAWKQVTAKENEPIIYQHRITELKKKKNEVEILLAEAEFKEKQVKTGNLAEFDQRFILPQTYIQNDETKTEFLHVKPEFLLKKEIERILTIDIPQKKSEFDAIVTKMKEDNQDVPNIQVPDTPGT